MFDVGDRNTGRCGLRAIGEVGICRRGTLSWLATRDIRAMTTSCPSMSPLQQAKNRQLLAHVGQGPPTMPPFKQVPVVGKRTTDDRHQLIVDSKTAGQHKVNKRWGRPGDDVINYVINPRNADQQQRQATDSKMAIADLNGYDMTVQDLVEHPRK
jgi:hypothetical protein